MIHVMKILFGTVRANIHVVPTKKYSRFRVLGFTGFIGWVNLGTKCTVVQTDIVYRKSNLSSLLTASYHIQEPHPLLVITLAQILAKKLPSFISASSLIGAYFFPVEIQAHPPIFEILR